MTTSVSSALTAEEQVFYDVVWNPLIMAGEMWLFAEETPVVAIPVVGEVVEEAEKETVSLISSDLFSKLTMLIDVTYLKFKNVEIQSAYEKSSESLTATIAKNGVQSNEYKTALQAAIAAQIALTSVSK